MGIPDVVDIGKSIAKEITKHRENRLTGEVRLSVVVVLTQGGIQKADMETTIKRRISKAGFKS